MMIDADAFFTNMNITLQSIVDMAREMHIGTSLDMIISEDCNGLNAGVFMIRVSEWSLDFLNEVWSVNDPQLPFVDVWWEQSAIRYILEQSTESKKHVAIVPQKLINCYPSTFQEECYAKWWKGDFIMHFVAGSKNSELPKYADQLHNITFGALRDLGS